LDVELFDTLLEAKVLIERWRVQYNTIRPHSSLGYRHPAPEAIQPWPNSPRRSLPNEKFIVPARERSDLHRRMPRRD